MFFCVPLVSFVSLMFPQRWSSAQAPDEATRLLQEYARIDTSNPAGDTRKAADFLAAIFEREGIPVSSEGKRWSGEGDTSRLSPSTTTRRIGAGSADTVEGAVGAGRASHAATIRARANADHIGTRRRSSWREPNPLIP
jgi:hypothetical protein